MTLKTEKKNEPSFPDRQLTVVNSTHILEKDLGRTLLLDWSGDLQPTQSLIAPGEEDTKIAKGPEKAIINIMISRLKGEEDLLIVGEFSTILEGANFHEKVTLIVKRENNERINMYKFIESTGETIPIASIKKEDW